MSAVLHPAAHKDVEHPGFCADALSSHLRRATGCDAHFWELQAKARIRAIYRARHACDDARHRLHYWVRILRLVRGS